MSWVPLAWPEPEIVDILYYIWNSSKRRNRRQRLSDIQSLTAYTKLLSKMPQWKYLFDAEITLMIDQVKKVDEEPYYLDRATDRIGYKIMDSISYEAQYGYRTGTDLQNILVIVHCSKIHLLACFYFFITIVVN